MTQWGLDTLFNPAKRHMDDEKRRLQSTREEVGDSSGGKRIDLESGKVVIHRDDEDEVASTDASEGAPADDAQADDTKANDAKAKRETKPTPAQARARARQAAAKKKKA